jgi:CO dehydrogenase nickel-insertion accessory protein CooC1
MKIAILGKGGSGKSSVSWLLINYLVSKQENNVLAIDTDNNRAGIKSSAIKK